MCVNRAFCIFFVIALGWLHSGAIRLNHDILITSNVKRVLFVEDLCEAILLESVPRLIY